MNEEGDFEYDKFYKKCGFKNPEHFKKQCSWSVKTKTNKKLFITVFAKTVGRANFENKYEFPPPIDNKLFFGSVCIICQEPDHSSEKYKLVPHNLTVSEWGEIYERLYGGFEDLSALEKEDEEEEDELENIPKDKLTSSGYLKDGFVVDDDNELLSNDDYDITNDEEEYTDENNTNKNNNNLSYNFSLNYNENADDYDVEIIGNELSEEEYIM
jgi:hypothetical protein